MKLLIIFAIFLASLTITGQNFHTEFSNDDSIHKGILIQNSYPKSGGRYTDIKGQDYAYAVFWTRITNETDSELEISINFPIDSDLNPSSSGVKFNLYLPKEEMTLEKDPLFDYGLDSKLFLDKNMGKPSDLLVTIDSKDSCSFYVVAVSNRGVNGVIRAGFELENQELIYKINNHKINCGRAVVKK